MLYSLPPSSQSKRAGPDTPPQGATPEHSEDDDADADARGGGRRAGRSDSSKASEDTTEDVAAAAKEESEDNAETIHAKKTGARSARRGSGSAAKTERDADADDDDAEPDADAADLLMNLLDPSHSEENLGNKVRSIHWSPYDRVGVVDADP